MTCQRLSIVHHGRVDLPRLDKQIAEAAVPFGSIGLQFQGSEVQQDRVAGFARRTQALCHLYEGAGIVRRKAQGALQVGQRGQPAARGVQR